MLKVEIDPGAGFCFGVEKVIKMAESRLKAGEELYGLGEMVHNRAETDHLRALGLKTIDHGELSRMRRGKILFRAHGEPPATYAMARSKGLEVIDGTCPIVDRLQKKLKRAYESIDREKDQIVIFGKADHPETIGLLGQVGGDALVVGSVEDIKQIDPHKNVYLFSQTTMDPEQFKEVEGGLEEHLSAALKKTVGEHFKSDCTICGQMKKRKPGLSVFARNYQLVLFVSGKHSSNGKMLYTYCKSINPNTHWISGADEVDPDWLKGFQSIGISGATSTSRRQLELVQERVKTLTSS